MNGAYSSFVVKSGAAETIKSAIVYCKSVSCFHSAICFCKLIFFRRLLGRT